MAEVIKDFLIVHSKDKDELDGGVIFLIESQFEDHGNIVFEVKRRDVNVEKTPGMYLAKKVLGAVAFKGQEEVDRLRKCIFKQENVVLIGRNPPRVYEAWADSFDELPSGYQNHKKWGLIMDMMYAADAKMEEEINTMKNSGMSVAEIHNTATASATTYFDMLSDNFKKLVELKLEDKGMSLPGGGQKALPPGQNPMQ